MSNRTSDNYAVTFTAPEHVEFIPREFDPRPAGPREVIGRTVRSLISPGTEVAGLLGQWPGGTKYPAVPGYAAVFEVTEVGAEVSDLKPGDLAFSMGGHQAMQRAAREYVVPLPAGLSPDIAPFARLMCVTMSTLTTTTARPPAKIIVTGLGIVGHLAAKLFAACGYEVMAVDPVAARRDIATRTGVKTVLPTIPLDDVTVSGKVALVVECSGHEQAIFDACRVVQKRGEVVLVAAMWQRKTDLYAYDVLHAIFNRYVVVRSGWEWEVPLVPSDFRPNSIYGNIAGAMHWLADGRVNVDGLAEAISPREASRAFEQLRRQPDKGLTFLFDWTR